MSRYIDADMLQEAMHHESMEIDTDMQKWESGCWIRYKLFTNVLEKQPTADVVPVKHGKWINEQSKVKGMFAEYCVECSECGRPTGYDRFPWTKYCPSCGARMDGAE